MNLALQPDGEDWLVSGTLQGQQIEHRLDGNVAPVSDLGQMMAVNSLFNGGGDQVTMDVWVPGANPTQFLASRVELTDKQQGDAVLTMGPMSMNVRFEPSGSLLAGTFKAGAAEINMERIWTDGAFPTR